MDKNHQLLIALCLPTNDVGSIWKSLDVRQQCAISELAIAHRCLDNLDAALRLAGRTVSEVSNAEIEAYLQNTTMRSAEQSTALDRGAAILQANGIPVIVLKGHAIARILYAGNAAYKRMNDVDILVPKESFREAVVLLTEGAFRTDQSPSSLHTNMNVHHYVPLISKEGAHLDIHWNITGKHGYRVDPAQLLQRAVKLENASSGLMRLGDLDLMHHLLIHFHYYRAKLADTFDLINFYEFLYRRNPGLIDDLQALSDESGAQEAHYRASNIAAATAPASGISTYAQRTSANWFWRREAKARHDDPQFIYEGRTNYFGCLEAALIDFGKLPAWQRIRSVPRILKLFLLPDVKHRQSLENSRQSKPTWNPLLHLLRIFYYYRRVI